MGSTSYPSKSRVGKSAGYKAPKSASSVCSDKENNAKLRRNKIRRGGKMNEYGAKRYPDYTEMAYKEAVSKLRYFLNGNYAPNLCSYGGSASIKNLDESDAETALDTKKSYPISAYGTPADYRTKVRPLMSRYLNTFGDSYKNYGSSATNLQNTSNMAAGATTSPSAVRPPAAVPTSDPNMINFVQKQGEYIEQLERESNYCREELSNLLGKVKEVISENEVLHEAQKNKLISRVFNYRGAGSDSDEDDIVDSTGLDSDNKLSPKKYCQSNRSGSGLHGPNIVFESRISELEAQLMQASIDLKKVQEENSENRRKLSEGIVDSSCIDSFKRQIENLQRDKGSLEVQVKKLHASLELQKSGGDDVLNKIKAGNENLEQQLRDERNNLETELRRVKDELSQERGKLRSVTGEGARRALQERDLAQRRYGQHLEDMSHDLAAQYDAVGKLQLELERQRRDESDLKRELSMKTTALEDLKMDFKNKTASLQADLAQAQAEKASLEEEIGAARLALERVQRQAKHDTNRLNSEISSLRSRLDRADADLVHARRENLRLAEQVANSEKELNMRNLRPESPTQDKNKELSNIVESLENKHAHTVAQLEAMIQSQNSLMDKLTGECQTLTYKLDDASRKHKLEMATLQRKVETLSESIQPAHPANTSHSQDNHGVFQPTGGLADPGSNATDLSELANIYGNPHDSPKHDRNLGNSKQPIMETRPHEIPQKSAKKPSTQIPPDKAYDEKTAPNETPTHNVYAERAEIENTNDTKRQDYDNQKLVHDTDGQSFETQGQDYETQRQNYDTQGQNYATEGQSYDTQGQDYATERQNYDTQGQNYDTQGQNYATEGQSYDTQGQNYATEGQNYDTQGQNYDTQGQNYDTQGQDYDTQGQNYATEGQSYDTQGQDYATEGQNYDTQGQNYATEGQNYDTQGKDYETEVQNYDAQGQNYDAQGQDYTTEGQNYDTQRQSYDDSNQEYAEGQHYQTEQNYGNKTNAYESAPIRENAFPTETGENAYPAETYEGQDQDFIPNETYPKDQYQQQYSEQQYDPNAQYTGSEVQNYPTNQYEEPTRDNPVHKDYTSDISKAHAEEQNVEKHDISGGNRKPLPLDGKEINNSPAGPPSKVQPKKKKPSEALRKS